LDSHSVGNGLNFVLMCWTLTLAI